MDFLVEPKDLLEEARQGEVLVVDARKPADYAKGHIPGAVNFTTYDIFALDTSAKGMAAFARDMAAKYVTIGVSNFRSGVVYDADAGIGGERDAWGLHTD